MVTEISQTTLSSSKRRLAQNERRKKKPPKKKPKSKTRTIFQHSKRGSPKLSASSRMISPSSGQEADSTQKC
jgi:hypothetical protein